MTPTAQEPELDGALDHTSRKITTMLSGVLAAAQAAAQIHAERARRAHQNADRLTRAAQQTQRDAARRDDLASRTVQRQADTATREAQQATASAERAVNSMREKQWSLKPTEQWWHDAPQSAAEAWASAAVHRDTDPLAARCAEQWETVFAREGVDMEDVRTRASRLQAEPQPAASVDHPHAADAAIDTFAGELAAETLIVAGGVAGAIDVLDHLQHHAADTAVDDVPTESTHELQMPASMREHAMAHQFDAPGSPDTREDLAARITALTATTPASSEPNPSDPQWTAYADGAEAARIGGMGVSKPAAEMLVDATAPAVAAASAVPQPVLQQVPTPGIGR